MRKIVRVEKTDVFLKDFQFCGYPMVSKSHSVVIQGSPIKNILVMDSELIYVLVSKKVKVKYERLIKILTELLISGDDEGGSIQEAMNLIEKFRLEVKNKYRKYLKEKEIREMSVQLKVMQQVALQKEMEIKASLAEEYISRSK